MAAAFGRVYAVVHPEWAEDDWEIDFDTSLAQYDDFFWSYHVTRAFSWQRYLVWWVSRRYIMPRDVRKR